MTSWSLMRDLDALRSHFTQGRRYRFHVRTPRAYAEPDKPAIVLVHGLGVSSRYMAPTAALLAGKYRVFAPDLPGFGKTSKPASRLDLDALADALAEWMDAEGLARATLIGNSVGCQTLVRFAVRHPDKLTALVLQGPTLDPSSGTPGQIVRWLRAGSREPFSLNWVILRDYLETRPWILLGTFVDALRDDLVTSLPAIEVPVLVVRGARDTIVSHEWAERIATLLPRGRLVTLPGAAHTINYSAPRAFLNVLTPFLEEHAPARDTHHEAPRLRS